MFANPVQIGRLPVSYAGSVARAWISSSQGWNRSCQLAPLFVTRTGPGWIRLERHLRITLLRQLLDPLVVLGDALADRFDRRQQGLKCRLQFRTQTLGFLRIHIPHVAATQPLAVALGQSMSRVDQPRPLALESSSDPLAPAHCDV
jgi:hypothetical protein